MSQQRNQTPTQEQIRNARRSGFARSVSHMPDERRLRITNSYHTQDSRREVNVSRFVNTVTGR